MATSYTPNTDLWAERSRFNGMLLGSVSYGIFFLLTIQTTKAILGKRNYNRDSSISGRTRTIFLTYIATTFVLATIGFASNARYTQTIWIDSRDIPGGPPVLINTELNFWINRLALSCYYIMEWLMSALLLYRTFIIWDHNIFVVLLMSSLFLGSIASSIVVLVQSRIKDFFDINSQIAYLSLTVGTNVLYTLLVVAKLLYAHLAMQRIPENVVYTKAYTSVIAMIVESAALYSILGVLYIASFATHSNFSNLIFLAISHVQGIAQLLIILRVVNGRAYRGTQDVDTKPQSGIVFGEIQIEPDMVISGTSQGLTVMGGSTLNSFRADGKSTNGEQKSNV
ncbi:hypothetical protein BDN70DRAFT_876827 [Pholiota conissans]|uniref:Uncharacterized protein n=1 Tax=Pholiota conissans TaxID=109636 RepID=A0A9P6CUX5_9AGAR|nr:hypothetical protein BDN70DRAFT_876827 [Pholiota conissans]